MISHRKWSVQHDLANDVTTVVLKNIQRALETMGEDGLNAFQLRPIAPYKVNLTPKLIRFNHLNNTEKQDNICYN